MIDEPLIRKQRLQGAGATAESERIHSEHRQIWRNVITPITSGLVFAIHRLTHDHPECVTRWGTVAGSEHELVGVRMLRPAVIKTKPACFRPREMSGDIKRC